MLRVSDFWTDKSDLKKQIHCFFVNKILIVAFRPPSPQEKTGTETRELRAKCQELCEVRVLSSSTNYFRPG